MLATVNPSKCPEAPSQIILPYIEESANIVYNEASHLFVNCTVLTNKRAIYLYIYLIARYLCVYAGVYAAYKINPSP